MNGSKKTAFLFLVLSVLFSLSGCRLGMPAEITLTVNPVKYKAGDDYFSVPVEVGEIVDKRSQFPHDVIGIYKTPIYNDVCKLTNFEQTVTTAFRESISSYQANEYSPENKKLVLAGEIQNFVISWESTGTQCTVGYSPLEINMSLADEQKQVVWQKVIKGNVSNLYWSGMFSLSAGEYMKGTAKKCITDAVGTLLIDPSFWEVVGKNQKKQIPENTSNR
jgi:hypothetical protein